ncbi:MAG: GlsB/YeaQ/YmgE family stress response membrane protein [Thermoleophilaceae bacterium]|nr:GlsB/YeaQ/YmgE family stress response membrane protein [Thermoleophilaceae bacterium]
MGIIGWILLGLIAGVIAKAIHPGDREPGGMLGTFGVGIFGALLGGFIASALGTGSIESFFSVGTWLIAVAGALLLVTIFNVVAAGSGRGARSA